MTQERWVSVAYGKINLKNTGQTVASLRITAPFKKESAAQTGRAEMSSREYMQSTRYRDVGGGFTRQRVMHPEGTVIALQATRTRNGICHAEGAIFLRLRHDADHLMITSILPTGPEGLLGDRLQVFQGAADILTAEEISILGLHMPSHYRKRYFNQDELDELFDIQVARKGAVSKPQLVALATSEGPVVRIIGQEEGRRIKIRKR
jgi:hypothetical protein